MAAVIRRARRQDAATLSAIAAATFPLACPPSTAKADLDSYIASDLTPERFEEHMASSARTLFAAEVGGTIVGYLMLTQGAAPAAVSARSPIELQRLYVLPPYHGSDVGASLMTQAIEAAAAGRHDVLWLSVSKENARGLGFYRKHGFAVLGEQRFPIGKDLHEDFIMGRRIEGARNS